VEVHFYIRSTKLEQINSFKQQNRLKHLGIPSYIGSGAHEKDGQKYRFLVMERFGSDLQRILDNSEGGRLTDKTVCEVGLQVIDALQYIHHQGYVHKDVKASNLLVGLGAEGQHKIHLVDYGLCSRFTVGGVHKQYTHDLRWAHEGTLEYTSRDAHIGCSSRRGDIEVLVYNLVEWWGGVLPWDREFASPAAAKIAKFRAFANPHKFLRHCFRKVGTYPGCLLELMNYTAALRFEQAPDYAHLRQILNREMRMNGHVRDGRLVFRLGSAATSAGTEAENATFLRPLDPETRISAIFDKLCISNTSWEQTRENMRRVQDEESLLNPTPAMLEVINKTNNRINNIKKRHKSESYYGDGSGYTPAMLAVMQRRKVRQAESQAEGEEPQTTSANIIPTNILRVSPVPREIVTGSPNSLFNRRFNGDGASGSCLNGANKTGLTRTRSREFPVVRSRELSRLDPFLSGGRPRELSRLDPFLSDSGGRMRTRSADVSSAETNRDLRSAFRFGFGNMRSLIRQVSDSFTNMF